MADTAIVPAVIDAPEHAVGEAASLALQGRCWRASARQSCPCGPRSWASRRRRRRVSGVLELAERAPAGQDSALHLGEGRPRLVILLLSERGAQVPAGSAEPSPDTQTVEATVTSDSLDQPTADDACPAACSALATSERGALPARAIARLPPRGRRPVHPNDPRPANNPCTDALRSCGSLRRLVRR